jgi:DNA processing protein
MVDPLFWQLLLAAEAPPKKSRALAWELGSSASGARRLSGHPRLSQAERDRLQAAGGSNLQAVLERGASIVTARDYPEPLSHAPVAPPALFAWGNWSCLSQMTIAIVGTRGASAYGKAVATKFAEAFAAAGATVVSGGALGIDAAAHKGALSREGATVAVLAGGIDSVYPAAHRALFQQIRDGGCLVSQFAAGVKPTTYRFLMRNHVVAALSEAVVVVEAPAKSGALGTAHAANEMGRQVFVVPANIGLDGFAGSHALIRDGATLVDHPDQVLEALGVDPSVSAGPVSRSEPAERILSALKTGPLELEFIVERTGIAVPSALSELTLLEMDGVVMRSPNGYALKP